MRTGKGMSEQKYSFKSRVRYSELDREGNLSVHGIINYMQDCSTFQSESVGAGMESLKEKRRAWLLAAWNIDIGTSVTLGSDIRISTWAGEFKGIYGDRNFTIQDESGRVCVKARSLWVYVNTESRHPARIDEEEIEAYGTAQSIDMEPARRKMSIPQECREREPFKIKKAHLDTNGHVNNAWYITLSMEYLPEEFTIRNIKAAYQKEITYGDVVYPAVSYEGRRTTVVFRDAKGKTSSIVEFNS